jgi:pimeloyl-ACP methyl ester carboxylesterase
MTFLHGWPEIGLLVELHDHLGARPAIWVGHDLGSPVAGALAAHHANRSRVSLSKYR